VVQEFGKVLMILGVVSLGLGLLLWSGFGSGWLGKLPGDIRVQRGNFSFYFPVLTCIIISIILAVVMSFLRR
jgi:hypothetical protein